MKFFLALVLATCATAVSAQHRLSWTQVSEILPNGHLEHLATTQDGTIYAMCFTRPVQGQPEVFRLLAQRQGQSSYATIWEPQGTKYQQGGVPRMQTYKDWIVFRASDGILLYRNGELDASLNSCRDSTSPIRIDVTDDGSTFVTGPMLLDPPEFDTANQRMRYGTTNVTQKIESGCKDVLVNRVFEKRIGIPWTVAKGNDGSVLVSYWGRPVESDVLLRTLDETPIPVSLVENQYAYDIEYMRPVRNGWIFCLLQTKDGAKDGLVIVKTDDQFRPVAQYVPKLAAGSSYRHFDVHDDHLVLVFSFDVQIIDINTMEKSVAYTIEDVIPEEHRKVGASINTAAVHGGTILIGAASGFATMSLPVLSGVDGSDETPRSMLVWDAESIEFPSMTPDVKVKISDIAGRSIEIEGEQTGDRIRIPVSRLFSGLNIIHAAGRIHVVVRVNH